MTGREIAYLVLVFLCAAVILAVLGRAVWRRGSASVDRAVNGLRFDEPRPDEQPFDPGTERAIAQALGVVRDPITLAGLVQPEDGQR